MDAVELIELIYIANCNIPSVLAEDIMIEYNPALHWHDTIAWLHNGGGLNKAYQLRNQTNGLKGLSNYNNSIPPEQMPISKEATSIHIFHPVAASWHQCTPPNGQDRMNWTKLEPSCELNQLVSLESHDDTQEVACRLISDFCPRFENATINVNDESSSITTTIPNLHCTFMVLRIYFHLGGLFKMTCLTTGCLI